MTWWRFDPQGNSEENCNLRRIRATHPSVGNDTLFFEAVTLAEAAQAFFLLTGVPHLWPHSDPAITAIGGCSQCASLYGVSPFSSLEAATSDARTKLADGCRQMPLAVFLMDASTVFDYDDVRRLMDILALAKPIAGEAEGP